MKKKIAIIGSGISGMSAYYHLSKNHKVMLFEQNTYLGGHTHTHSLTMQDGIVNVDSGFIVFNNYNYKNFIHFIKQLKIKYQVSDMSFSVISNKKKYEWSGRNFKTLLLSNNILTLRYWRILRDIFKFNKISKQYVANKINSDETVSQFLKRLRFSNEFRDFYFYPMCASIWSNPIGKIRGYKIHFILSFFSNHGLINIIKKRPVWYTIANGSKTYVEKITKLSKKSKIILEKVVKIEVDKKTLLTEKGKKYKYDHVVIATHADDAKKIINPITKEQKKVLNMVSYKCNTAILHTDESVMPKNISNWSSWNFLEINKTFALTYWMNLLQNLKTKVNIFVSINCDDRIEKSKIIKKINYKHPVFNNKIDDLNNALLKIQGKNNVWFVGAWQGYGFHEDGIKSSLNVIKKINS